ncbi:3-methyl-2-oxobutanoate hydroxymethyltransferase [Phytophthora ramorum]|uniref:3-methyl-2-oxobutanoate hydroxymethyltransferase n=1 Tax=Phytophthora ramorum TaxID=164328 RepID=UPI0030A15D7E|nr:3-methyl-2-oxobutanoate hydroxymethyltransferase [Phytophthora ramorum]
MVAHSPTPRQFLGGPCDGMRHVDCWPSPMCCCYESSSCSRGSWARLRTPGSVNAQNHMRLAHCRLLDTNPPWVARPIGHGGAGMTLETMIHHTQAVKRGASRPLVITNTPFGRCEGSPCEAPKNAQHLVKEGGAGCVQVEGPSEGGKERSRNDHDHR